MPYATAPDGTRIFYERFSPEGKSKRLPIVLIAGWATSSRLWLAAVERGVAEGYELVTIDSRGTGRSDLPRRPWSTTTLARDVVAVIDDARISRAHVAAPSLGGMVAQELALRYPARVGAMVLAATTGGLPRIGFYRLTGLAGLVAGRGPAASPADPTAARGNLFGLMAAAAHSSWSRLPFLRVPVQVQHGSADPLISPRAGRALAATIPGAELQILDGAGHALILERPDDSMNRALTFLERHWPAAGAKPRGPAGPAPRRRRDCASRGRLR
jgi:pimeloyl-ACP methyl ester carboxylesterase